MIEWGTIVYGSVLSGIAAGAVVALLVRERRTALVAALTATLGPLAWNAILRDTGSDGFFVDAPVSILPASWQDTGSGVFALALSSLVLGLTVLRTASGLRLVLAGLICGLAAFLVDVYLY